MINKINELYEQMQQKYGGLSSTSTKKFDDIVSSIAELLGIPEEEVYATGSGSRPGNLEVRLSQGIRATIHTTVGLGFIVDEKNNPDNVVKLTNSALVTCKKFLGRGKAHYDNIVIFVESEGTIKASGIICQRKTPITNKLIEEFNIDNIQEVATTNLNESDKDSDFDITSVPHSNLPFATVLSTKPCPHQQIFYGAPGTGKSHTIKRVVEDGNLPHLRTTFHPDSDYSTFVGAYKPTSIEVPMRDVSGHIIVEGGNQVIEKKIIYTFVPQAFLKAYVAAWSNLNEPFFLIIEEINRGNCAQIFGDLFQLLDRNSEGISDYPVTSDDDIRRYLNSKFSALDDAQRADIPDEILSGEIMRLPQNLYIWATMNTSDQSLFPIDSAFKRRWDWKYTPIANGNKDWKITADGKEYDWWQFLEIINTQIGNATHSEDKKLGYYFCKPINNQTIDAETFVSKVVFYLWNDVFKDFAEDAGSIFNDEDGSVLSFNKFYTTDADGNAVVVEQKVTQFLQNLGIEPLQDVE